MERVHSRGGLRWSSNLIRCIPHEHGAISTHREREREIPLPYDIVNYYKL
jgi:hypothetical protein